MTALYVAGLAAMLALIAAAYWRLCDYQDGPAPVDRPGTDSQWEDLLPAMRSVRRHRRRRGRQLRHVCTCRPTART